MTRRIDLYQTYEEASAACIRLNIKSGNEYAARRFEDPMLPAAPREFYKSNWTGFYHFLGKEKVNFYKYEDAKVVVCRAGITTQAEYNTFCKTDHRLPSKPFATYSKSWVSWNEFLDQRENKYRDFYEARTVARSLGFRTLKDYTSNCIRLDPMLYTNPQVAYKEWTNWQDYLNIEKKPKLLTYKEAQALVLKLGIQTSREYQLAKEEHPELAGQPSSTYHKHWVDWATFLQQKIPYTVYAEAQKAARAVGIRTEEEYAACYAEEDPKLPKDPSKTYGDDWRGWDEFLGHVPHYKSVAEATAAVRHLGIKTKGEYLARFREDAMLPRCPDIIYKDEWPAAGWRTFIAGEYYPTMQAAAAAARALGITMLKDWKHLAHLDPKLPLTPQEVYKEFTNWKSFILPENLGSFEDAKFAVRLLGIKNSVEYKEKQTLYPCLPSDPSRVYRTEWTDWYDFCDIVRPYTFEEAKEILTALGLRTSQHYRSYIASSGDNRLPLSPGTVYKSSWKGWLDYLGREQKYIISSIPDSHAAWRQTIGSYLQSVKSAAAKENYLVKLVREFLIPLKIGREPIAIFTVDRFTLTEFELFVGSMKETIQRKFVNALREFSERFIRDNLSITCDHTKERIIIQGARDPFAPMNKDVGVVAPPSETTKPAIAYHFVAELQNWIIPPTAESFSDLKHLQAFSGDWFKVEKDRIDFNDPDCVWKLEKGKYKIWFPGFWLHTYALASVPLRGVQLAYIDSGEGDDEIPVVEDGKIIWKDNPSHFRGQKKDQGFVKKYPKNQIGMHVTTNKTSQTRPEYDIPWMPENLAHWCIRLRNWQTKYNPISEPTRWEDCRYTNLNLEDRRAKKENCFLFRDFNTTECSRSFASRLGNRIAIGLYNIQTGGVKLASCDGAPHKAKSYSSEYTAHTMRVSLITAYVMEFKLDLEIIVKIAGHSSVIMSIYYVKVNGEMLRIKFDEGEKRALANRAQAIWQMAEQGRREEIKGQLITNNEGALKRFVGEIIAGSALFRDYGMCLFAATRCADGYLAENGSFIPVPAGYLGSENCVRCRHFVTGPVFLGGLLSLANEISLSARLQFDHLGQMEQQIAEIDAKLKELRYQQYDAEAEGLNFNEAPIIELQLEKTSIKSQIEAASRKADMYLSDMNSINRLASQCQAVINERSDDQDDSEATQLIMHRDHEAMIQIEETSFFHQLNEVCENAEIYVSAKAELAVTPRTQLLDRMIQFNDMKPSLFMLDAKQQLAIGNQITKFMLARLKSWEKLDAVVDGRLLMRDLPEHQRLNEVVIKQFLAGAQAQELLANAVDDNSGQSGLKGLSGPASKISISEVGTLIEYDEGVSV